MRMVLLDIKNNIMNIRKALRRDKLKDENPKHKRGDIDTYLNRKAKRKLLKERRKENRINYDL